SALPHPGPATMRLSPLPLALVLVIAASAAAAQLQNENLLVSVPDGFKIDFQQKNKDMLISEMVPSAESVNDWTQMVTVQIFFGLKGGPEEFKSKVETAWMRACRGGSAHAIAQGKENGYSFAVWLLACPLNRTTGKPEFTWFKATQATTASTWCKQRSRRGRRRRRPRAGWNISGRCACATPACPTAPVRPRWSSKNASRSFRRVCRIRATLQSRVPDPRESARRRL